MLGTSNYLCVFRQFKFTCWQAFHQVAAVWVTDTVHQMLISHTSTSSQLVQDVSNLCSSLFLLGHQLREFGRTWQTRLVGPARRCNLTMSTNSNPSSQESPGWGFVQCTCAIELRCTMHQRAFSLIGIHRAHGSMVRGDVPGLSNFNTWLLASLPWEYGGVSSQHNLTDLFTHSYRSQQGQLYLDRLGCTFRMNTRIRRILVFSPLACSQF
jgi:hypothetical protein